MMFGYDLYFYNPNDKVNPGNLYLPDGSVVQFPGS